MKEKKFKNIFEYEPLDLENSKQLKFYEKLWLDPGIRKYCTYFLSFPNFEEFLEEQSKEIYFVKFENNYIGWVRYILLDIPKKEYEILYFISSEFRKQNYGEKVVKDFTNYLKNEKQASTLYSMVRHDNEEDKMILEKNGFQLRKEYSGYHDYYEWKKNPKN